MARYRLDGPPPFVNDPRALHLWDLALAQLPKEPQAGAVADLVHACRWASNHFHHTRLLSREMDPEERLLLEERAAHVKQLAIERLARFGLTESDLDWARSLGR